MEKTTTYNIQMVSRVTGLGIHTLRIWERRYNAVTPKRNQSGHRQYNDVELEKLQLLSQVISLGGRIGEYANLTVEELKNVFKDLSLEDESITLSPNQYQFASDIDKERIITHLLMALENYKLDILSHEIHKLRIQLNPRELVFDVLIPLFQIIGKKVSIGEFDIAQEHALSSLIKFHMGQFIFGNYEKKKRKGTKIALTTPEGESHEFGMLFSALLCVYYGVDFVYLGTNLPAKSLNQVIQSLDIDIALLGVSNSSARKSNEHDSFIESILNNEKSDLKVWFGGALCFDLKHFERYDNFKYLPNLEILDLELSNLK